jgi:iron complex outermembrane receptor protein
VPVTPVAGAGGTARSATGERIEGGGNLSLAKVPLR